MSGSYQLGFYKSLRAQVATVLLDWAFRVDQEVSRANISYLLTRWRGTPLDLIPRTASGVQRTNVGDVTWGTTLTKSINGNKKS